MARKTKIFISKSSDNDSLAFSFCNALEREWFECWIAPRDIPPGVDWPDEIMRGIEQCDAFLAIMTPESNVSAQCANELVNASNMGKKLLGVKIGDYEMSSTNKYYLSGVQLMMLPENFTQEEFNRVIQEISTLLKTTRNKKILIKHNLPVKPTMVGRVQEYERALKAINHTSQVLNIYGMPGIGKKTLANAIGHYYVDNNIYDMLIWINAEKKSLTLSDIIDQMALISGAQYLISMDQEEKEFAALSLLQEKNCIFIINGFNNLLDESPINFIKKLNFDDAVILTSDAPITSFDSMERIHITGLTSDETKELALLEASRIGLPGLEEAPLKMFQDLRRYTSGNPHAIKLSIGQVKSGMGFDRVILGLSKARGRVFEDIYSKTWSMLSDVSKDILFAMTTFSGSASFDALLYVCDLDDWDFMEGVQELINVSMLESNYAFDSFLMRYSTLTITENYIKSKVPKYEGFSLFVDRFVEFFSDYLQKNRNHFPNIIKELDNIKHLCKVLKDKDPVLFSQTILKLYAFMRDTGFWDEAVELYKSAIDLNINSKNQNSLDIISILRTQLSSFYLRLGSNKDLENARENLNLALESFISKNDKAGETRVLGRLGRIALREKKYEEALELSLKALKIAEKIGLDDIIPDLEHEIGDEYFMLNKYDEAERMYLSSLNKYKAQENEIRIIGRYNDLGKLYLHRKEFKKAEKFLMKSIEMANEHQKMDTLCRAKISLGELYLLIIRYPESKKYLTEGLDLANRLNANSEAMKAEALIKQLDEQYQETNV